MGPSNEHAHDLAPSPGWTGCSSASGAARRGPCASSEPAPPTYGAAPGDHWFSRAVRSIPWICAGVFAALLLIELPALLHLVDYRHVDWLSPDRYDPELLDVHRPHAHLYGSALGGQASVGYEIPRSEMSLYQWDAKYDAHGFRNNADLDRADTVVLGASFVEGMTIPASALMTTLLAHQTGTVVENLGRQNFSPQQDLIALKRYGLPLRPRTVIWMFTDFNDLRQVLYYRDYMAAREPAGFWPEIRQRSFTRFAYRELRSDLKSAPGDLRSTPKKDGASVSGLVADTHGKMVRMYFIHPFKPLNAEWLSAVGDTRNAFASAYALGAAQGTRLVVVFVPEAFRVFQPFARFPANSECRQWTLDDEPRRIEAAVRSISPDIGYLDLTSVMRQAVGEGTIPYYTDDNHWTPQGHQIAARAIGDYLLQTRVGSPAGGQF